MAEIRTFTESDDLGSLLDGDGARSWLFKHSLTCPISARAWREFQDFVATRPDDDPTGYYLIEVQRSRDLSKEVAERTGVRHESPQALLVDGGEVLWHASHGRIRRESLDEAASTETASTAS